MSESNQALTIDPAKKNALPLQGEKQPTGKIIGLMVMFLVILAINYFVLHHAEQRPAVQKDTERFDVAQTRSTPVSQPVITRAKEDMTREHELEKKLEEAKARDFIDRLQAPQNSSGTNATYSAGTAGAPLSQGNNNKLISYNGGGGARITDPNTAFLLQESNTKAEHVYATHYGLLPYLIGQGKFIFANLAVAINSDLPGQITATVSQDIYGEQGRKILIPKGSLLIGEYKSGLVNNQSRLFIVWTRVREPNGIDVMLGSEGTDPLGRAGLTGDVDYHFFARFGSAFLIAMIGAGASTVGVNPNDQYNSASAYRENVSQALAQQANSTLDQNIHIPPTINVPQGQKIVVFVNRDLDFSRVIR